MPGHRALFKQRGDSVGDTVVYLIFHVTFLRWYFFVKELCEPTMKRMPRGKIKVGGQTCQNWHVIKKSDPDGSLVCLVIFWHQDCGNVSVGLADDPELDMIGRAIN